MKTITLIFFISSFLCFNSLFANNLEKEENAKEERDLFGDEPVKFEKKDMLTGIGIGLGSTQFRHWHHIFDTNWHYSTRMPPISGSFEYGLLEDVFIRNLNFGVGGFFGYKTTRYTWDMYDGSVFTEERGFHYRSMIFAGKGTFHYPLNVFSNPFEVYGGGMIGYDFIEASYIGEHIGNPEMENMIFWSPYVGARYYLTRDFAAIVELGGMPYLNFGVTYKFGTEEFTDNFKETKTYQRVDSWEISETVKSWELGDKIKFWDDPDKVEEVEEVEEEEVKEVKEKEDRRRQPPRGRSRMDRLSRWWDDMKFRLRRTFGGF